MAFGLISSLDRRIADNVVALREGKWAKSEFSKARGLFGSTLGLVGIGQIGAEMIPRAQGFGMPVIGWSRSLTAEKAERLGITRKDTPLEVAAEADIVSVHVALNSSTRGLIGEEFFQAMKPGAMFINTARGEVIDQQALAKAIREKGIRAGLDVFANEPSGGSGEFADPIVKEAGRLRHPPHRRLHRPGPGSHRRRSGANHSRFQRNWQSSQRCQSRQGDPGEVVP